MVQEELNDIYEDIMIYTSIPQDILRYHRIFSHEIFFIFLQSEIFQIVEKWLCPFSTRCDQLNINHLSTIWNISDCRKMAVTIQYEVWLAQWFKKNWKISMSIIYTPQDISGCCIVKYFSIMKYFQSWNIWITWSFKLDLVYRISVCNFKSFRFYSSRKSPDEFEKRTVVVVTSVRLPNQINLKTLPSWWPHCNRSVDTG